jgi:hypothetical protein
MNEFEKVVVSTIYATKEEGHEINFVNVSGNDIDLIEMATTVVKRTLVESPELLNRTRKAMRNVFREISAQRRRDKNWILEIVLYYAIVGFATWGVFNAGAHFLGWILRIAGVA